MIEHFLDHSPTFYLFGLGVVMRWIGSYIHQRYPRVAFFQFSCSVVVFALVAGRRLTINPPQDSVEVIEAFIRAGSFAMIAFGGMGGIGTMFLLCRDWKQGHDRRISEAERIEKAKIDQEEQRLRREASAAAKLRSPEEIERINREHAARLNREQEEADLLERSKLAEIAERRTLRLRLELAARERMAASRQPAFMDTAETYLTEDMEMREYRARVEMLREHIERESESTTNSGFESLTAIEQAFAEKKTEIESLEINIVEKESLASYLAKEKQAAIHKFLKKEVS